MEEEKYISHIEHHKSEAEDEFSQADGSKVERGMVVCRGSGGSGGGGWVRCVRWSKLLFHK